MQVLADGFYEWKQEKAGKQPYYVHLAPPKQQAGGEAAGDKAAEAQGAGETKLAEGGRGSSGGSGGAAGSGSGGSGGNGGGGGGEVVPLVMAGLWDVWQGSGGEPLHTYTILTTGGCAGLFGAGREYPG